MRWFKHDTDARNDVRIRLLKKQYGAEGYGVYFQLLEIIGEFVEKDNITDWGSVDKFHTVETLAEECGVSPDRLREILTYCNKLDLFKKKNGRLYCAKILKRLDDYAQRAKNDAEKLPTKSEQSRNTSGTKSDIEKKRREKKRREQIRTEEKRVERKPSPEDLTQEVIEKIATDYHLPIAFVVSKADDLKNWCASKGKTYKDYPAALRNWVKKDAEKIVQAQRLPSKSVDASSQFQEGGNYALVSP